MKKRGMSRAVRRSQTGGLTDAETDVIQVLWDRGAATVAEVRSALAPTREIAHTTVITMLDRMCRKGSVVQVEGAGRAKRYRAVVGRNTVANSILGALKQRFFHGSTVSLLAHLLESDDVDEDELREIRKLLEESRR